MQERCLFQQYPPEESVQRRHDVEDNGILCVRGLRSEERTGSRGNRKESRFSQ